MMVNFYDYKNISTEILRDLKLIEKISPVGKSAHILKTARLRADTYTGKKKKNIANLNKISTIFSIIANQSCTQKFFRCLGGCFMKEGNSFFRLKLFLQLGYNKITLLMILFLRILTK